MEFVVQKRLGWSGEKGMEMGDRKPFEDAERDLKVLWNDWPYGLDGKIVSCLRAFLISVMGCCV